MKEEYNRLFEKVAPRMSDDELFKAVLDGGKGHSMENNKNTSPKKRSRKALLITAVASVAAAATTVGAVAIYNRSVNEEYGDLFEQFADEHFPQVYTDKDGDTSYMKYEALESGLYETLNIELNKTFELEGYTLEIPGAISDGEEILIMYNLVFDEDPWSGDDPWYKEGEKIYLDCNYDDMRVNGGHRLHLSTISERDGKTVYSSFINWRGLKWYTTDTLKISFDRLDTSFGSEVRYLDAEIEIPITDDFTKFNKAIDISDVSCAVLDGGESLDLVRFEATPLGVVINAKTDGEIIFNHSFLNDFISGVSTYVTFKDGSTLEAIGMTSAYTDEDNKTMVGKVSFNYPVEVDDIQSIQFANVLVNMEDGSSTTVGNSEMFVMG